MKLAAALALVLGSAACNQGDSDNVMAAGANALTPAQVDLALGPELANNAGNGLDETNEASGAESENAVEAADEEDALDESVADEPVTSNMDSEQ